MATSGGNANAISLGGSGHNQSGQTLTSDQLLCAPFILPNFVNSSMLGIDLNRQLVQIPVSSQQHVNMLQAIPKQEHQTQNSSGSSKKHRSNQQQQQLIQPHQQIAPHLLTSAIAFPGNPLQSHSQQQLQSQQQHTAIIIPAATSVSQGGRNSNATFSNATLATVWPCPACKIPFKSASELQTHLSSTHTKAEKSVPCGQCGKLFASAERVRIHIRVAHGEKSCACEICGSGFSYRCKLLDHMRTHTGDKPFQCDVCGRSFSQKNHLRRHQMIHTGERPYPCEVCGRGFYRKDKLSRHRRIHQNPGSGGRSSKNANNANNNSSAAATAAAVQQQQQQMVASVVAQAQQQQGTTFQLIPVQVAAASGQFKNTPISAATQQWIASQQLSVANGVSSANDVQSNSSTPTTSS
ncbi:Zinc finger protein [Halotydeus destructor]|nr:Zinc finger protein [Halotydeus destructor]